MSSDHYGSLAGELADLLPEPQWPIREKSLKGIPRPETSIERTCRTCGASFIRTAPGKTHERGIWNDWAWYCSLECAPVAVRTANIPNRPKGG